MKRPSNFEQAFDKILFHLDEAYRKSNDENTRIIVSRTTDDIFHRVICIIQERINHVKAENQKGFFQKVSEYASNIISNLGLAGSGVVFAVEVAPEVSNLASAFFDYMLTKWELRQEESYFYNQLANVYQKILDSRSFNSQYGLIRNTFTTNKEEILTYVVYQKGLVAARNLMKYDEKDSEKQDSIRIISRALISIGEWEKCANFLNDIKGTGVANYLELKDELLESYSHFLEYIKKWSSRKDKAGRAIRKKFPTRDSLEYFVVEGNLGYAKYMRNRRVKKYAIATIIFVLFIAFLTWASIEGEKLQQQESNYRKTNYSVLENKWSEVRTAADEVEQFVSEKKYKEALKKAKTGIVFSDNSGLANNYINKTNSLQKVSLAKIVKGILGEINILISKDLDNNRYEYITDELIPLFNSIIIDFPTGDQELYTKELDALYEKVNKARDVYLVRLENTIKDLLSQNQYKAAKEIASNLTHKSSAKRGILSTYDEYWAGKKDKYLKKIPISE